MMRRLLLVGLVLAGRAWAQAPCTENSPSGQYNCNVFASADQTTTPGNLALILENNSSATPHTQCTATESGVAGKDCLEISDGDNTGTEKFRIIYGTNIIRLGPGQIILSDENTGGTEPVNGAGIYWEGGASLDASLIYNSTADQLQFNYGVNAPAFYGQTMSTTSYGGAFRMDTALTISGTFNNFDMVRLNGTVTYEDDGLATLPSRGVMVGPTLVNPSGEARAFGSYDAFDDLTTHSYNATTGAVSLTDHRSFYGRPTFTRSAGANTDTITAASGFVWAPTAINSNVTVTTLRGVYIKTPTTLSGTVTTNIGVDIEDLAGSTQIGLRNADTTVWTPTTQAIAAASNTVASDTTLKAFSTVTGDTVMTSAPTVADGQSGQVITYLNVDGTDTDCIVLKDQGTLASSNLRLATRRFKMCPRDVLGLTYNATVGDWVELYRKKRITTPTIGSGNCGTGTSGVLTAGSTDYAGEVTTGTGSPTSCTITWGEAKDTDKPFCVVSWGSTPSTTIQAAPSTTGIVILLTAGTSSAHFYYYCADV